MKLKPIPVNPDKYPASLHPYLSGANLYDSSCSPEAQVIFINKDNGYFLKIAAAASLAYEYEMTRYFHNKGLAAKVIEYIFDSEQAWLLTEKIQGDNCTAAQYLDDPKRLCDVLAERLALLHSLDHAGCPVANHTERYLLGVAQNYQAGHFDRSWLPENQASSDPEGAYAIVQAQGHLLKTDTLLHGDYCLPNIILNDWQFSGFIDLDSGGVGDRHADLFWGAWTLNFNLKTDQYRQRFFDAYGRDKIDEERLRVVAACEMFG